VSRLDSALSDVWHYVKAIGNYHAEDAEELSLTVGDVLRVRTSDLSGWLDGELVTPARKRRAHSPHADADANADANVDSRGHANQRYQRKGWFPSTFVERCTKNGDKPGTASPHGREDGSGHRGEGGGSASHNATGSHRPFPKIDTHGGSMRAIGKPFEVCARVCVHACVCACVRACVCAGGYGTVSAHLTLVSCCCVGVRALCV